MKTMLKTLLIGAALAVGSTSLVTTAQAADSVVGTWKLDVAKSKFTPGPAYKSQTRVYSESANGLTLITTTTDASGKEMTNQLTFKYDGKPYAATGNADFDMVSVTRVDAMTVHSTQTKAGKTVGSGIRTVSKDGKTLTFKQKGTHADGTKYDDVLMYDKQ